MIELLGNGLYTLKGFFSLHLPVKPVKTTLIPRQRAALTAVCRTILLDESIPGQESLATAASRAEQLIESLSDPADFARLGQLLTALGSPVVNLLSSGHWGSFATMDTAERQAVLQSWANSRVPLRRAGFQALKRLTNVAYYCWPSGGGTHPSWQAAGYPGPLPQPAGGPKPLPTFEVERDTELTCDVAVVGSGAGGGVAAGVLAAQGLDVLVLERGPNPVKDQMTQVEGEMLGRLYLDGGLLMTQSGSMPVLAGSCLGGGTVINYTTSFPLPPETRKEWDTISGLSLFSSRRFTESLERVSQRLNVGTTWTTPGKRDALLERGCRKLGWHVDVIPRNVTDCPEGLECGYCGYGCRHGAKNDNTRTYLADAAAAGARLVVDCEVERITSGRARATGVVARVRRSNGQTYNVTVRANSVVVACGAVHTPALLRRSGLSNANIGRNLRLHPATALAGVFKQRVEPWAGSLQTRYSDQFADLSDGYGAKFETAPVHFALPASAFGWNGAAQSKQDFEQLAQTSIVGILLRDRDPGKVTVNRHGRPRVHYEISRSDVANVRVALRGAAQILEAAGATEIFSLHTPPVRTRLTESGWLDRFMDSTDQLGYRHCRMSYVSFHQMATASVGSSPKDSVVNEAGETHELRDLYVADASVFPTSSGVNPMITIMAIADHVARGIVERDGKGGKGQ
jgi:choline dehydrogenase-like flavoprotein